MTQTEAWTKMRDCRRLARTELECLATDATDTSNSRLWYREQLEAKVLPWLAKAEAYKAIAEAMETIERNEIFLNAK